jgi:hypothetical protein
MPGRRGGKRLSRLAVALLILEEKHDPDGGKH